MKTFFYPCGTFSKIASIARNRPICKLAMMYCVTIKGMMNLSYGPSIAEVKSALSYVVKTENDKDSKHPGPYSPTIWKDLNLINLKLEQGFKRQLL